MEINHQKIRERRRQKDLSQEYMAYVLGISQSQYSKLENGIKVFDIEILSKLCDVLELSPLEIIWFYKKQKLLIDNIQFLTEEENKNIGGGEQYKPWFLINQRINFHCKYF